MLCSSQGCFSLPVNKICLITIPANKAPTNKPNPSKLDKTAVIIAIIRAPPNKLVSDSFLSKKRSSLGNIANLNKNSAVTKIITFTNAIEIP